jgi:hypothetical protein
MNYLIQNEKITNSSIFQEMALGLTSSLYLSHQRYKKKKWGDLKVSGTIDNFEIKSKI